MLVNVLSWMYIFIGIGVYSRCQRFGCRKRVVLYAGCIPAMAVLFERRYYGEKIYKSGVLSRNFNLDQSILIVIASKRNFKIFEFFKNIKVLYHDWYRIKSSY